MVLKIPVRQVFDLVGHNGLAKLWPDKPEPLCYQGFHIQEMIDVALVHGYSLTPIEAMPRSGDPVMPIWPDQNGEARILRYMKNNIGIIIGATHAMACDHGRYCDPSTGRVTETLPMPIKEFWILKEILK